MLGAQSAGPVGWFAVPGEIAGVGLVRVRAAVAVIHAVWEMSRMEGITHEAEATEESDITDMDMTEPLAQERARIEREEAQLEGFADIARGTMEEPGASGRDHVYLPNWYITFEVKNNGRSGLVAQPSFLPVLP